MQKTVIPVLLVLVLVLSAALIRSQGREREMEERLAAVGRVRPSKAVPELVPAAEERLPAPRVPESAEARPAAKPAVPPKQMPADAPTIPPVWGNGRMTVMFGQPAGVLAPQLHLTEAQKKAIADLHRDGELQTLTYREMQQKVEAQTEEAIRRLLDPQQLLAYDAMGKVQGDVQILPAEDDGAPLSGRRPGYLGIVGVDAQGGGVQVSQVQPGTVAGNSGLQNGDIILEVNGEKVTSYGDLAGKVRRNGEGGPVTLRIRRGTSEFYQGVQLGQRPP